MLPIIVSPTKLRRKLAHYLDLAAHQIVVVTDKESNKVILDESEYNRLCRLSQKHSQKSVYQKKSRPLAERRKKLRKAE